jgi:hypothetical protein
MRALFPLSVHLIISPWRNDLRSPRGGWYKASLEMKLKVDAKFAKK